MQSTEDWQFDWFYMLTNALVAFGELPDQLLNLTSYELPQPPAFLLLCTRHKAQSL